LGGGKKRSAPSVGSTGRDSRNFPFGGSEQRLLDTRLEREKAKGYGGERQNGSFIILFITVGRGNPGELNTRKESGLVSSAKEERGISYSVREGGEKGSTRGQERLRRIVN